MRGIPKTLAVLASLLVGLSQAADPPAIRLPESPAVVPQPMVPPTAVSKIRPGEWFIIDSDKPVVVIASPVGFVTITSETNAEACPVRFKGVFAGGTGAVETKTFKGKQIVTVEALAAGQCELLIIPVGLKTESEIVRRTVDVEAGQGPQPPPGGGTPPTKPLKGFFLIVRPDGPASAEFVRIFSDPAWAELKAAGHTVKELTLTESIATYKPPAGTAVPYVVTLDTRDGKSKVIAGPVLLPTDSAGIRKLAEGLPK